MSMRKILDEAEANGVAFWTPELGTDGKSFRLHSIEGGIECRMTARSGLKYRSLFGEEKWTIEIWDEISDHTKPKPGSKFKNKVATYKFDGTFDEAQASISKVSIEYIRSGDRKKAYDKMNAEADITAEKERQERIARHAKEKADDKSRREYERKHRRWALKDAGKIF